MLPLLLVFGSIRMIATDLYLSFEYGRPDFPIDRFGFDTAQRLAYASANLRYVRDGLPIEALAGQNINGAPLYNSRELGHMQDVQGVYQVAGWGWMLALNLFLLVALALGWRKDTRPALAAGLKRGGLLTAGLVAGIGVLVVVAWRMWFTAFHQVFFLPGTWVFNATDTLIRLFPEKFWFDTALMLAGLSLTGGLLVAVIGWRLRRRFQPAPAYIGSMES
jgi:integral membrane protein (TIGR01906 family)